MSYQIVELKLEHEQEKTHLFQQHNAEKDCLVRDYEQETEKLEKQLQAAMTEYENNIQECRKRDAQVIINSISKDIGLFLKNNQYFLFSSLVVNARYLIF